MNPEHKMIYEKKLLPTTVGKFCDIIGAPFTLYGLEPDLVIPSFITADDLPAQHGGFYLPYNKSDLEIRSFIDAGAMGVLADHYIEGIPCIVTDDPIRAIYYIGKWLYTAIELPCTMIAGSVGKTTLKRMLANILRTEMNIHYLYDNYNAMHSLPSSFQLIASDAEYLVQEVDEKRTNNPFFCSKILSPEIIAITNITDSHIGHFGSQEALLASFRGITAGMDEKGVVIINADDPVSAATDFHPNIIRVGIHSENADCRAARIKTNEKGTSFDLHYQGRTVRVKLSIPGEHNVYNAMMAYVIGKRKGIREENILAALKRFQSAGIRQNYCRYQGTLVYADCYNANAMSVSYAIKCFCEMRHQGKRIAVLGDIAEISGFEEPIYRKIAEAIDHSSLDMLLTCGEYSEMIQQFVTKSLIKKHFHTKDELIVFLKALKKDGKNAYLFKASRSMTLETCIREVFPEHYALLINSSRHSFIQSVRRKIPSLR